MLVSLIIQYSCISAYGNYVQACHSATNAFLKQTGAEKNISNIESYSKSKAKKLAIRYMGDDTLKTLGSAYYAYHVMQTKTISFPLPTLGLANGLDTTLTPSSIQLAVRWNLR